ncbi:ATP-grasp domain-containing protein [Clostridium sp. DL1XJH146]
MNGWIIYNGTLKITKIQALVFKFSKIAKEKGINFYTVKNNELIPFYNSLGEAQLKSLVKLEEPDFIVFWDKDIFLARHLELMGYKLFNTREAIEICDNKALMQLYLSKTGIRVPKTIVAPFVFNQQELKDDYFNMVHNILGDKFVLKESFGSFGMQVYKLEGIEALKDKINEIENSDFIIQEYIESSYGKDIRVNIVGDKIIGAMERKNPFDFRANITAGGKGELIQLNKEQKDIAMQAHKALNLDFSGVDLLYGENNEPILCEVNSNVNFLSFEDISQVDFSNILLDYILGRIR